MNFPYPSSIYADGIEFNIDSNKLSIPRSTPIQTRKNARSILKGLKILWKKSSQKGFFESTGEQIHGNTNDQQSKYQKLYTHCSQGDLIAIGNKSPFTITSYVDGSYTISLEKS